jgi:hypothetical protein
MNPDFLDIIRALLDAETRFIVVGAYALNIYIDPRATGDLDIWIEATPENARKVMRALKEFGAPLSDVSESDFARPGVTFQIGIAPRRIDLLTELSGIEFQEAWNDHSMFPFGPFTIPFLSKAALIKNKRATGRPKDLLDLEELDKAWRTT